jgi:uncharacterized protein YdhG (YjbR/CyaY superfamily)
MTQAKPAKKRAAGSGSNATSAGSRSTGFTEDERAAMKARARELKAEERASKNRAEGERELLAAIEAMSEPDRTLAKRVHAIVEATAPDLWSKTWYGMPAYTKDGKVVCFFKSAEKFKSRYATLGFEEAANLDDGVMWPTSYAVKDITSAEEKKIVGLVKKAVS